MEKPYNSQEELSHEDNARLVIDFFHRTMMHHSMWFAEVQRQFGPERSKEIMESAYSKSYSIQMKRLSEILGFEMVDDIPKPLLEMSKEELEGLKKSAAVNWLANDGVWFQAVEFTNGMDDAKSCNDTCWGQFTPFEAWSVKRFLALTENPGLDGLKKALEFRLYASINKQTVILENSNSLVLHMNECRVQVARKRKGLADYPCKSAGIVEYTAFAEAIDKRITTECIACPPDKHPEEWFCAWRFRI